MYTARNGHHFLSSVLTALWIAIGMGIVAMLGYGSHCKDPSKEEPKVEDDNAATGYLLHTTIDNTRLFSCRFRCAASLISSNVIATSRSCVEFFQARDRSRNRDTIDRFDRNWAFGAPSKGNANICGGTV